MGELTQDTFEGAGVSFEITQPTAEDMATVGPVHLQSWIETYKNPDLGVDDAWIRENVGFVATPEGTAFRQDLLKKIEAGDDSLFYRVARDTRGEIKGFCMAKREPDGSGRVDALYLLAEAQGQGLGAKLMDEMLGWLDDTKPIKLQVVEYNKHAIDFYKKYGFELTDEKEEFVAPVNVVWMVKE